ncbi:hypothetical protein GGP41_005749 [Bipolaris sorokiniana]|uniref:Uncharacterized protein n=1 Tax=Cochliobolus sativus TaxID=45130 RepID=A0A8H6DVU1_COCSA|nr:hypothetical protein GGP41_005749 [Bipolaris sorokiniana]
MLLFNRKALLAQSGLSAPTLPPNNLAMLTVRKPKLVGDEQVPKFSDAPVDYLGLASMVQVDYPRHLFKISPDPQRRPLHLN